MNPAPIVDYLPLVKGTHKYSQCDTMHLIHSSNSNQRYVMHNYHDHAFDGTEEETMACESRIEPYENKKDTKCHGVDPTPKSRKRVYRKGPRGGVAQPFPEKLHAMLSIVEDDGNAYIVSWQPHGRSFLVHKPKEFVSKIMPMFFRQSKLTSFQRQLNLYGFSRLTSGADRGAYYHELFLRGRPYLCTNMIRTRIKGTGIKAASSPSSEPNFYYMAPIPYLDESKAKLQKSHVVPDTTSSDETVEKENLQVDVVPIEEERYEIPLLLAVSEEPTDDIIPLQIPKVDPSGGGIAATPVTPTFSTKKTMPAPHKFPDELMLDRSFTPPPLTPTPEARQDGAMYFEGRRFHYLDSSSIDIPPNRRKVCTPARMVSMDSGSSSNSLKEAPVAKNNGRASQQSEGGAFSLDGCCESSGLWLSVDPDKVELSLDEFPMMEMLLY